MLGNTDSGTPVPDPQGSSPGGDTPAESARGSRRVRVNVGRPEITPKRCGGTVDSLLLLNLYWTKHNIIL